MKIIFIIIANNYINTSDSLTIYHYWSNQFYLMYNGFSYDNEFLIDITWIPLISITSIFYYIFDNNIIVGNLLNLLFHMFSSYFIYCLTNEIYNKKTALISLVLFLSWPSITLWSLSFLRESIILLFLTFGLYLFIMWYNHNKKLYFVLLFISIIFIIILRPHVGFIFLLFIFISAIRKIKYNKTNVLLISFIFIIMIYLYVNNIQLYSISDFLYMVEHQRDSITRSNTAFFIDYKIESLKDFIYYIPNGIAYFLFGPFPNELNSYKYIMLFFLETILFLLLFPFLSYSIFSSIKKRSFLHCNIIIFMIIIMITYSLIEVNLANLIRHKIQFTFLAIIFISNGIKKLFLN